jgi:hypothetical protein
MPNSTTLGQLGTFTFSSQRRDADDGRERGLVREHRQLSGPDRSFRTRTSPTAAPRSLFERSLGDITATTGEQAVASITGFSIVEQHRRDKDVPSEGLWPPGQRNRSQLGHDGLCERGAPHDDVEGMVRRHRKDRQASGVTAADLAGVDLTGLTMVDFDDYDS